MSRKIRIAAGDKLFGKATEHQEAFEKQFHVQLTFIKVTNSKEASVDNLVKTLEHAEVVLWTEIDISTVAKHLHSSTMWLQLAAEGVNGITSLDDVSKSKLKKCSITRGGGVYTVKMAEYVVGAVISMEREFPMIYKRQSKKQWQEVHRYRTLPSLTIGILGLGEIGKHVAKVCSSLGMTVYGLRSTSEPCEHVERVFATDQLPELLEKRDYVCNILPSTTETKGLLSGDILKTFADRKSCFINIGRGDVLDENSLVAALNNGWISKAFLDVFETEPLPETSLLWMMENVILTPHSSGFNLDWADSVIKLFYNNLRRYVNREELKYLYCWESGYWQFGLFARRLEDSKLCCVHKP